MAATTVQEVMTPNPVTVGSETPLAEVARRMRDAHIGDVLVEDAGKACGIVTDRDIVVQAIAEDKDPRATTVGEICSHRLMRVAPNDPATRAVDMMRSESIRRLAVMDGDRVVGIVSLGDLAVERDPSSVLADISASPPTDKP